MKALITGGAGFAGSHLAEYLLAQGFQVAVLIRRREPLDRLVRIAPQIRIESGDVRDAECVGKILRTLRPDRVFHLAALSSPEESLRDPELIYAVNFGGTLNLLGECARANLDCRILTVSSSEVYGAPSPDRLPVKEDSPLHPLNPYAGSKAASEMLALQYFESHGLHIVRVRPFNHTGPRQSPAFVCSSLAKQIAEIELGLRPPEIAVGNLQSRRDFSDVRDIVQGYLLLLEAGRAGDVYQLCSGRPVAIEEVLHMLIASASTPVRVTVEQSKIRLHDAPARWGDASKARETAGWQPAFSLQATLLDLKRYWIETLSSGAEKGVQAAS